MTDTGITTVEDDIIVIRRGGVEFAAEHEESGLFIRTQDADRCWDGHDITLTPSEARHLRDRIDAWFPGDEEDQR